MKKLAEQTNRSADQITQLIHRIQQESIRISQQMKESKLVVEQGTLKVQSSEYHFHNIGDSVHQVVEQMTEAEVLVKKILNHSFDVAKSSSQMHKALSAINSRVESISAATVQQNASTEEVSASLHLLSQDAGHLKELVNQFILYSEVTERATFSKE